MQKLSYHIFLLYGFHAGLLSLQNTQFMLQKLGVIWVWNDKKLYVYYITGSFLVLGGMLKGVCVFTDLGKLHY